MQMQMQHRYPCPPPFASPRCQPYLFTEEDVRKWYLLCNMNSTTVSAVCRGRDVSNEISSRSHSTNMSNMCLTNSSKNAGLSGRTNEHCWQAGVSAVIGYKWCATIQHGILDYRRMTASETRCCFVMTHEITPFLDFTKQHNLQQCKDRFRMDLRYP